MRYVMLHGGKRLRPLLVYTTGTCFSTPLEALDMPAAAIEMIHCFSLVHDDLPAMDDDDLRRNRATCHKAFDEATAILTGDALQSLAFELLAQETSNLNDQQRLAMLKVLSRATGSRGMAGGQALDLAAENQTLSLDEVAQLQQLKTGQLIAASVQLGLIAANCQELSICQPMLEFSQAIGLAFQIQDDILDIESTPEVIGKTPGKDQHANKATYPALIGIAGAQEKKQQLHQQALEKLTHVPVNTDALKQLAEKMIFRDK